MLEMLELQSEYGIVKLINDTSFRVDSADNLRSYDRIYYANSNNYASTQFGIFTPVAQVLTVNNGSASGLHKDCYVIDSRTLYLCTGDSIFCLAIPSLELLWISKVDPASCFGIYKITDGFIVHGELEISRIDNNGTLIWQRSGSDIFTTLDGIGNFKIENNIIHAKSWDGRRYRFTLDGEILM